jgi:hypothetical protein
VVKLWYTSQGDCLLAHNWILPERVNSIGFGADTLALEKSGKLVPLLREAGAISGSASKDTMTA